MKIRDQKDSGDSGADLREAAEKFGAALAAIRGTVNAASISLADFHRDTERQEILGRALRAVSIKAKNLRAGDLVEWGFGWGQQEVNGWARYETSVIISTGHGLLWTLDPEQRVRVYNRA